MLFICLFFGSSVGRSLGSTSKIELVQDTVQKTCGKSVSSDEALRLVKELFLNCIPSSKVVLEANCAVLCLKQNAGAVIGQ
jgi:hypothetical protein